MGELLGAWGHLACRPSPSVELNNTHTRSLMPSSCWENRWKENPKRYSALWTPKWVCKERRESVTAHLHWRRPRPAIRPDWSVSVQNAGILWFSTHKFHMEKQFPWGWKLFFSRLVQTPLFSKHAYMPSTPWDIFSSTFRPTLLTRENSLHFPIHVMEFFVKGNERFSRLESFSSSGSFSVPKSWENAEVVFGPQCGASLAWRLYGPDPEAVDAGSGICVVSNRRYWKRRPQSLSSFGGAML